MSKFRVSFVLAVALAAAALGSAPAFAGWDKSSLTTTAASQLDGAAARVRVKGKGSRAEVRFEVERAASGLTIEVFVADGSGAMVSAGTMREDANTPGEYRLRFRSKKGDTLPGGAATLADLDGRAIEYRDETGFVIASGAFGTASGGNGGGSGGGGNSGSGGGRGRGRGGDDGANHTKRGRGADDLAGDTRRGRGADDAATHTKRGRGADDAPGHVRRGRGADDAANHQ